MCCLTCYESYKHESVSCCFHCKSLLQHHSRGHSRGHTRGHSALTGRSGRTAKGADDGTDSDASIDEDDLFVIKKGKEEFEPVEGNVGLYFKVV